MVRFEAGSRVAGLYGSTEVVEPFYCSYGLAAEWVGRFAAEGMHVTARGTEGEPRLLELERHPFFLGTLFVPQMRSQEDAPDPIVRAFAQAAGA